MGAKWRPAVGLVVAIALVLAGCSSSGTDQRVPVDPAGGTFGSASGPAQVVIPPGIARDGTVTISTEGDVPSGSVADVDPFATAVGAPVRIEPDQDLVGAEVSLPVDLVALPEAAARRATAANVFVAVFEPRSRAWWPLPTRVDPAAGRAIASAPHFSWFRTFVVDPASDVWDATTDGVTAVLKKAYTTIANPPKKDIDCPSDNRGWQVSTPRPEVQACVEPAVEGQELRVENGFRFPAAMQLPRGLTPGGEAPTKLVPILSALFHRPLRQQVVEGRGVTAVPIPGGVPEVALPFTSDDFGVALSFLFAGLSIAPEGKIIVREIEEIAVRGAFVELAGESLTIGAFVQRLAVIVEREVKASPEWVENAKLFNDIASCASARFDAAGPTPLLDRVLGIVKGCLGAAVKSFEAGLGEARSVVLGILSSIPDTIEALAGLYDRTRTGGGLLTPFAVTASRVVENRLVGADWASIVGTGSCGAPGAVELGAQAYGDLTGDGLADAAVAGSCVSPTSSNPVQVHVFDGVSDPADPAELAVVPNDDSLYLRDLSLAIAGNRLRLSGDNISAAGALCCPDQTYRQVFTWQDGTLVAGQAALASK